jgi:hypothetical protein
VWDVLEDGPPQEAARGEITDVLEVQEQLILERGVIRGREVPGEIRDEPEPERNRSQRQESRARKAPKLCGEGRRDSEDEEGRRPLGENDVL